MHLSSFSFFLFASLFNYFSFFSSKDLRVVCGFLGPAFFSSLLILFGFEAGLDKSVPERLEPLSNKDEYGEVSK